MVLQMVRKSGRDYKLGSYSCVQWAELIPRKQYAIPNWFGRGLFLIHLYSA